MLMFVGMRNARMVALTLVVVLLAAGLAPREVRGEATDKPVDPELAQLGRDLEQGYAKLEQALRQAPRESFDPQAVIEQVGRDPAKLSAWVQENTDLLPYRGALRGPRGVMMDRGGNSLDRSLLLAELIASAGFEVRLANATLSPEQAAALAGTVAPTRAHHPQSRSNGNAKPDTTKFRERVGRHAGDLLAALGQAPASAGPATFATALSDHWWVQRGNGNGNGNGAWVDVDPCGVAPLPAPARTIPFKARDGMLPLESKDCHEVTLRLVVEAFLDGQLKTQPVLQQTVRPIEVIDQPLRLTHYADAEPINEGLFFEGGDKAAAEIRRAMIEQKLFLPVLYLGTNALTDASFDTAGNVDKNPKLDNAGKMAGGISSAMGGAFGGLTGGSAKKDAADVLTAEWIEYEIRVPGEQPQTIRRMVFDLIGPVARTAGVTTEASRVGRRTL